MAAKSVRAIKAMMLEAAKMLPDSRDDVALAVVIGTAICDHDWGADSRASHCTKCGMSFVAHISEEYS